MSEDTKECPQFNEEQLKELFGLVKRSMKEDAEIAVFLCGTKEAPILGNICTGSRCEVDISKTEKCSVRGKPFGLFHTHPHTKPWTNSTDATACSAQDLSTSCVSGNDKAPWIIVGSEDPAPIKNLAIRCHAVKSFKAMQQIAEKWQNAEKLHADAMKNADAVTEKLKAEGADWKTIMDERMKQFAPVDKVTANLQKYIRREWRLNREGCVFKK